MTRSKRRGVSNAGMQGAPVAVSSDIQQYTQFSSGRTGNALKMRTCAAIAEIQRISTDIRGSALALSGGVTAPSMQLNLTEPMVNSPTSGIVAVDYVSPVFDLLASAFTRYRISKLIFHYEPQCAATTTERLVFAFAEDPVHPILWDTTPFPTQNSLLAVSDSIAFAPWRSWSMDVTSRLPKKDLLYTFSDRSTVLETLANRFSDFGVISCVTSSASGANTACGVLYMECEIELVEFCPISVTRPASKHLAKRFGGASSSSDEDTETTENASKCSCSTAPCDRK